MKILIFVLFLLLPINFYGIDPVDYMIVFLALFRFAFFIKKPIITKNEGLLILIFILFIIPIIVSLVHSGFETNMLSNLIINFILFFLIVFLNAKYSTDFLFKCIIASVLISTIFSYTQYFLDLPLFSFQMEIVRHQRFMSYMGDPNMLGAFVIFVLMVIAYNIYIKLNLWDVLLFAWFLFVLLSTESRSAYAGFIISILVFSYYWFREKKISYKLVVSTGILLISAIFFDSFLEYSEEKIFRNSEMKAESERFSFVYTISAIKLIPDNLLGVGLGKTAEFTGHRHVDGFGIGSHHSFVQIFTELGVISGILYTLIYLIMFLALKRESVLNIKARILFSWMMGFLFFMQFQDTILWKYFWLIYAIIVREIFLLSEVIKVGNSYLIKNAIQNKK